MKKLLSLFSSLLILGTSATTVVACDNAQQENANSAEEVLKKIKTTEIDIPITLNFFENSDISGNSLLPVAIKAQLAFSNSELSIGDLETLTFTAEEPLAEGVPVDVTVTSTLDGQSASKNIKVTLTESLATKLYDSVIKLSDTTIFIEPNSATKASDPDVSVALSSYLAIESGLPISDIRDMLTFSNQDASSSINVNTPTKVNVFITGPIKITYNFTINVQYKQGDAQKIANKITNPSVIIPYSASPDTSNPAVINQLKTELKSNNPTLTQTDIDTFHFEKTVIDSHNQKIQLEIQAQDKSTALLQITVNVDFSPAKKIANKIANSTLSLPFKSPTSTTNVNTINLIKGNLKKANPLLTNEDLSKISFSNETLTPGINTTVTATINKEGSTTNVKLNIGVDQEYTFSSVSGTSFSIKQFKTFDDKTAIATFDRFQSVNQLQKGTNSNPPNQKPAWTFSPLSITGIPSQAQIQYSAMADNNQTIYVKTIEGSNYYIYKGIREQDGSYSFTKLDHAAVPANINIEQMVLANNGDLFVMYAGGSQDEGKGLYVYDGSAQTWSRYESNYDLSSISVSNDGSTVAASYGTYVFLLTKEASGSFTTTVTNASALSSSPTKIIYTSAGIVYYLTDRFIYALTINSENKLTVNTNPVFSANLQKYGFMYNVFTDSNQDNQRLFIASVDTSVRPLARSLGVLTLQGDGSFSSDYIAYPSLKTQNKNIIWGLENRLNSNDLYVMSASGLILGSYNTPYSP